MAGAVTAWVAETWVRRSSRQGVAVVPSASAATDTCSEARTGGPRAQVGRTPRTLDRWLAALADLASPLAVTCAVVAVLPDFDVFVHTHRTYSHSLGAAAIAGGVAALVAWRLRLPVVRTAAICAAAYASHVLLDWLGRDDSRLAGPMALWPLTTLHFKSGLDLFLEFTLLHRRRFDVVAMFARNAQALGREVLILGGPFLVAAVMKLRSSRPATSSPEARAPNGRPALSRAPVTHEERG
jgi:hypothetical protein